MGSIRDQLLRRLQGADVAAPSAEALDRIDTYVELLTRWNRRMNLTALPLEPPTDDAIDRLLVEPLAAVPHLIRLLREAPPDCVTAWTRADRWLDIGSGGGSPAIPIKLAGLPLSLVMVESKARKAAFLREVVRTLALEDTEVVNSRAEELDDELAASAQLMTVRAVKLDSDFQTLAMRLLRPGGHLTIFSSSPTDLSPTTSAANDELERSDAHHLLRDKPSHLSIYMNVSRGTSLPPQTR